ncbi:DedA family protein [Streptomyces sp. NPDC096311]|uniref:DedA family protein n=1 Tax=Streptomyces sp. NPDC096311 TaxID=3366083 RepID=UPI0038287EB6
MNALSTILTHVPPVAAYAVVAAAVLAESILLVGAFIPTFTLLMTAGALARTGYISLVLVIAVAVSAAVAGDLLGYHTGRLLGDQLRTGRVGRRIPGVAWHRAEALMTRFGGRAVFMARFVPVVRTLAPHAAGATHLRYRRIAPYSVFAACLWATAEAGTEYATATSLVQVLTRVGPAVAVVVLVAMGAVVLLVKKRGHSFRRRTSALPSQDTAVTLER